MGDSNTLTVKTELGEVVVHKMPLSDYAELFRALNNLPKSLGTLMGDDVDLKKMDTAQIVQMLPGILANSWDDIGSILAVATDKDGEFLMKLDAADAIEVIDVILDLNDFARIGRAVKKMQARLAKINQTQKPDQK